MMRPMLIFLSGVLLAGMAVWGPGCGKGQGNLPGPDVVASFDGGQITKDQIRRQYDGLMPCCRGRYGGLEGHKALIREMVFPRVIGRFVKARKLELKEDIREALGDLTDQMNLSFLHMKMHEEILNSEEKFSDLREQYERSRMRLRGLPLSERYQEMVKLHEQLHPQLAEEVEKYTQRYIEDLKRNAAITVKYEVLQMDIREQELKAFYQSHREGYHREEYVEPAKVRISQIQINTKREGEDDCASCAEEEAQKALAALRSGARFEEVARQYSEGPYAAQGGRVPDTIVKGSRGPDFDEVAFSLRPGEISEPFRDGESFYIIRLEEKIQERQKGYREILDQLRTEYRWEKAERFLEENRDRVVFTLNGKPYTIEDLLKEYRRTTPKHACHHKGGPPVPKGAPPRQCAFAHLDVEEQKKLVDRMIERELVVEDTYAQMIQVEYKEEIDQAKAMVLYPIFHEEAMKERINVTDKMVEAEYRKHGERYMTPAQAKISFILIKGGESQEDRKRALRKAKEVHRKLKPPFYTFRKPVDFADAAKTYSEDKKTAPNGGRFEGDIFECRDALEYITMHGFHREIFKLKPGEISDVFEYNGDYYIVQMRDLTERQPKPLPDVAEFIGEELTQRKHKEVMETWENELLSSIGLTFYDEAIKSLLDEEREGRKVAEGGSPPSVPAASGQRGSPSR